MRINASAGDTCSVSIDLGLYETYNSELVESLAYRAARAAVYMQDLYEQVAAEPEVVAFAVAVQEIEDPDPMVDYEPLEDGDEECCEGECDDCPFYEGCDPFDTDDAEFDDE